MTIAPPRTHLNEQVYETLKQRLVNRNLGAGSKISLHELADELGVSRSPVHHALTRLVQEGLLSVKARRGYYVTPVTTEAIAEGYDVRLALELHAAEQSVGRVTPEQLARFRRLMEDSALALDASDDEWDAMNAAFHECQIDLAGNKLLTRFYRELSINQMMQVIRGGRVEGGTYLAREHAAIVAAFEREDIAAAREAIRAHIESGRQIALNAIERAGGRL
jgi:DNA-binding GntR family transcriptional regulator